MSAATPGPSAAGDTRAGRWQLASYVLVGTVPVMAAWLLVTRPSDQSATTVRATSPAAARSPVPTSATPAVASPSAQPAAPGGCPATAGSAGALDAVPPDLSWSVSDGELVPSSPSAGPMLDDGGVARCFADSSEGALIAAVRIQAQIVAATPASWPAARKGLVAGPLADALDAQVTTVLAQPQPPADTLTPLSAVAGFKFVSYAPDSAVVEIVYRSRSGVLYASDETMAWVAGDWHIALLGPGELSSPQSVVASLVGYVEWPEP